MADERAIIKLGLKTGAGSSHGKSVHGPIRFLILHSVYDSLGRLATASEQTALLYKPASQLPVSRSRSSPVPEVVVGFLKNDTTSYRL